MSLQIKLLGSLNITDETGASSELLNWSKGCALLAYLIVTNQPQSREGVADLLWEAMSTKQSLQNLRNLLTRTKKFMPGLEVTRKQLAFPPAAAASIDYSTLRQALDHGTLSEVDQALQLYQGDLLNGFIIETAPLFNEWLVVVREQLRREVIVAYRRVCEHYMEQNAWVTAAAAAERWSKLDEFDEEALRVLLQALASAGNVEEALQTYNESRIRIWADLGVELEEATVEVAQTLKELKADADSNFTWQLPAEVSLEWPAESLSEPGPLPPNALIPYQRNEDFTGRELSLRTLAEHLRPAGSNDDGRPRPVAISGMGGLGKTQLAIEYVYRYGRYYPGGVFWMNFSEAENVAEEVAIVGGERGLGLYRQADKLTLLDRVGRVQKAWQEPIPRLLIFDNCEEEALLETWVPTTGGCQVLLTSRRANWSRELAVNVWPLAVLDPHECAALLDRLVDDINAADALEIAAELGHLPLALHLAGSFLNRYQQVTPQIYLTQLRDRGLLSHPSLEGRGVTHSPTGHDLHVGRTFAINLDQLTLDDDVDLLARQLLTRATYFAPGEPIPINLLQRTISRDEDQDDVLAILLIEDGLQRLLSLGLLEKRGPNVVIHRLVAAFTRLEIDDEAAQEDVEQMLIERLKEALNAGQNYLGSLPMAAAHVQTAVRRTLESHRPSSGLLVAIWGQHLFDIGNLNEAREVLETALELPPSALDDATRAHMHGYIGTALWQIGETALAWPHYELALEIRKRVLGPQSKKVADSLNNLAILHSRKNNLAEALGRYEQALAIYEQLEEPDQESIARTLYNLGILHRRMGHFDEASVRYQRAAELRRTIYHANHPALVDSLNGIGILAFDRGDYVEAERYLRDALDRRRQGRPMVERSLVTALVNLANLYLQLERYDEALPLIQEALSYDNATTLLGSSLESRLHRIAGQIYLALNQPEVAFDYLDHSYRLHGQFDAIMVEQAWTVQALSEYYLTLSEYETAKEHLDRQKELLEQISALDQSVSARYYINLGRYYRWSSDDEAAQQAFDKARTSLENDAVHRSHVDWRWLDENAQS